MQAWSETGVASAVPTPWPRQVSGTAPRENICLLYQTHFKDDSTKERFTKIDLIQALTVFVP